MKLLPNQETLNKLTSLATIISLIAVPVVITVLGLVIQSSISSEGIKKDYVSMATQILASEPKNGDHEDLRKWAIDILALNSPVPFTPALRFQLKSKSWLKPQQNYDYDSKQFVPPEDLMTDPIPPLENNNANSNENARRNKANSEKLKELQNWVNKKRQEEVARNKFFSDAQKNH